ncbi:dTMP kinase [Candidatus Woesearchaeota archaeon]|nr:dTMP kinase [Candidatus Woesearchaeota archaeon]
MICVSSFLITEDKMQGKFIVFEGIDGCGKGTQLKLASSYLFDLSKNHDIFLTREPTRDFKEIRKRLAEQTDAKQDAKWYANAFVKDRKNHLKRYIRPNLKNGTHVLSDRYKYSTLTYQQTQGMPLQKLLDIHKNMLIPDLTIIFDCPAKIAFERRKKDGATEVFDKDLKFQEELRQNYIKLKEQLPQENIIIIDATRQIEKVFDDVKKHIKYLF